MSLHTPAPVVCLHSLFLDPRMFDGLADAAQGRLDIIAPELLGQVSRVNEATGTISMDDVTDDVLQSLDQLGLTRYSLVGQSMGGDVAIRIAARRPQAVEKLVLLGSSAREQSQKDLGNFFDLPDRIERDGFTPEIVDGVMTIMFGESTLAQTEREDIHTLWRGRIAALSPALAHAVRGVFEREGCLELLPSIAAPALIVSGTEDIGRPPSWSDEMFDGIPHAVLLRHKHGHSPILELPDLVIPAILQFLDPQ
ncbi:alpha/beta hydrolase [Arthrobacter sp. MI7-26]|uniref:alpha/beta fold hydrolase n=1 Tax=Arthrobacter sp. MI7-26 TaxID=2993653 RepID=UPI002248C2A9|nr:alpha/beta hydrolase [Arthrobacter sp. MI7-26]MCX2748067.1 alpha/beta hydrolase [Arthrobacter sp. MI7-26]